MILDVPLTPDADYAAFLAECGPGLGSVHFSLHSPLSSDGRAGVDRDRFGDLARCLGMLKNMRTYALLNARFQDPARTLDPEAVRSTAGLLAELRERGGLTGIIYADAYHLRALSEHGGSAVVGLVAVPSVNLHLDSADTIAAQMRLVAGTVFAAPDRVVLDRWLNHAPDELAKVSAACRERFPGLKLYLLANEGCLPHCPYKPAHDALIGLANLPGAANHTFALNRDYGCVVEIVSEPWRMFTSPFIRPEDCARFAGVVDGIKVCGRERGGTEYLKRVVTAYLAGKYEGNLLSILDTLGEFEDRYHVPNQKLGEDFMETVTGCGQRCDGCGRCRELFERVAVVVGPAEATLRPSMKSRDREKE